MSEFPVSELIGEIEGEIWHRNRVYTNLVEAGRMSDEQATLKIERMLVLRDWLARILATKGNVVIKSSPKVKYE